MKLKAILSAVMISLAFTVNANANDINLSWDVRTIKAQAFSENIKYIKFNKYLKFTKNKNDRSTSTPRKKSKL